MRDKKLTKQLLSIGKQANTRIREELIEAKMIVRISIKLYAVLHTRNSLRQCTRRIQMRIGDYECYSLEFGTFKMDGGVLFGAIPKTQWSQKISADDNNLVTLKSRCLLLQGNEKNILVDPGFGYKLSDEDKKQYGIDSDPIDLNLLLSGFELEPSQITDVVLSHLHFLQAGSSTNRFHQTLEPTFPNAYYWVQNEHFEYACNPHERDRGHFKEEDFFPIRDSNQLQLLEGSVPLFDGIEIMVSYGHTPAQQHLLVKGEDQSLFFCGDMIPTTSHIEVSYQSSLDNRPIDHYPEKDFFLRKAVRENWILFFPNDPQIAAAKVKNGPIWVELDSEVVL